MLTVKEIRALTGLSQSKFSAITNIPKRTIENWESGKSYPPAYVVDLLYFWLVQCGFIIFRVSE